METLPLDLASIVPKKTTFTIGGKALTLCPWSLRVRAWATEKYTSQGVKKIFEEQRISEIAEIAWFMLEEKSIFDNDIVKFLDTVQSIQDQIDLIKALLGAVGIGEPEIAKINAATKALEEKGKVASEKESPDPKPKASKKKTGAKSSTP